MATKKTKTKKEKAMPKLDPDDQSTAATTTVAPAPLPAGQTSTSGFGSPAASTATTGGFGRSATTSTGFGSASGASTFGSTPAGGFGSSSSGFGSTPSTGASSFGSSSSGFGGSSGGFGSSGGGFGGGMTGGMGGGMQMQNQQSTAEAANAFGGIMAAQAASGAEPEHWMKSFWRPAMGWLYMLICFCDFIVFPALTMFLPVIERMFGLTMGYTPWQSLTLSNGGLIHLSFGAILGVSAYGRTQEKKAG